VTPSTMSNEKKLKLLEAFGSTHAHRHLQALNYEATICPDKDNTPTPGAVACAFGVFNPSLWAWFLFELEEGLTYTIEVDRFDCALDPAMALYRGEGTTIAGLFPGVSTSELLFVNAADDNDLNACDGPKNDPKLVIEITAATAGIYSLAVASFFSGTCPADGDFDFEVVIDPAPSCLTCTEDDKCGMCSPRDCDSDSQCADGLLCADEHKDELSAHDFDPRKADCGDVGESKWELCFNADIIKLGECEVDCDVDSDCKYGLLCADAHKQELEGLGLDPRKAYCGGVVDKPISGWNLEVCYNPSTAAGD
jgi:hypothetical protein